MKIKIIDIKDEDFVNYKKASMYIAFPYCTFKCGRENCQNVQLEDSKLIEIETESIVKRYLMNDYTDAIIMCGLEPFDSFQELYALIKDFRKYTKDDIVIYTGYNKDEIEEEIGMLSATQENIIVKFGRYIANTINIYDDVLGVKLASSNQYAERIS